MSSDLSYTCACCGETHPELPLSFGFRTPHHWSDDLADDPDSFVNTDLCVVRKEAFFIHGLLEIPVTDLDEKFTWGVWVSVSPENFQRAVREWENPARVAEPAYFGWLSTQVPGYEPTTINLKTMLHTRAVGLRPVIELEPTDHPLAVEQRTGIDLDRVRAIGESMSHGKA